MHVTQVICMLLEGKVSLPAGPVVLTFDDGFADFYTNALPVLQQCGFTATLYIATGFIGNMSRWLVREGEATRPMLTWTQVNEIGACGIECGGDTHWPPQLETPPLAAAAAEIVLCKALLEAHPRPKGSRVASP